MKKLFPSLIGILCAGILTIPITLSAVIATGTYTRNDTPYAYLTFSSTNVNANKVYWEGNYYSYTGGSIYYPGGNQVILRQYYGTLVYSSLNATSYFRQDSVVMEGDYTSNSIAIDGYTYYK